MSYDEFVKAVCANVFSYAGENKTIEWTLVTCNTDNAGA